MCITASPACPYMPSALLFQPFLSTDWRTALQSTHHIIMSKGTKSLVLRDYITGESYSSWRLIGGNYDPQYRSSVEAIANALPLLISELTFRRFFRTGNNNDGKGASAMHVSVGIAVFPLCRAPRSLGRKVKIQAAPLLYISYEHLNNKGKCNCTYFTGYLHFTSSQSC